MNACCYAYVCIYTSSYNKDVTFSFLFPFRFFQERNPPKMTIEESEIQNVLKQPFKIVFIFEVRTEAISIVSKVSGETRARQTVLQLSCSYI